jgi:hypothetical protein
VPGGANNVASGFGSFATGWRAKATNDGAFVFADNTAADFGSTVANEFAVRAYGGVRFKAGASTTASIASGSTSWSFVSDRNSKENFRPVDTKNLLKRATSIPMMTWNYKEQDKTIRHIGPVAQDFHDAFKVGENDTSISTVDGIGVALAAIQGLTTIVDEKDAEIHALEERIQKIETLLKNQ